MAAFTQGLYPFEIVLLIGGIVLLVILLVGLVVGLVRGKIPAVLVPLFIIAIAMIGYPSVQSINYDKLTVNLNHDLEQVSQNPTDPNARTRLADVANQIAARPTTDSATIATLASAQYALGDENDAQANLGKALQLSPNQPVAVTLKNKIASVEKLDQLTSAVQKNPADDATKRQLQLATSQVSSMPLANPKAIATLATAQRLTGNPEAAQKNTQKAITINPNAFRFQTSKP